MRRHSSDTHTHTRKGKKSIKPIIIRAESDGVENQFEGDRQKKSSRAYKRLFGGNKPDLNALILDFKVVFTLFFLNNF